MGVNSGGSKTVGGRPAARAPARGAVSKTRAAALKRAGRLMARFAITGGKGM